jgi:hypothetical protein
VVGVRFRCDCCGWRVLWLLVYKNNGAQPRLYFFNTLFTKFAHLSDSNVHFFCRKTYLSTISFFIFWIHGYEDVIIDLNGGRVA